MSLADQISDARTAGSAARFEAYGELVGFRGQQVPATLSAPDFSVIPGEGGDEIRVEQTCAIAITSLAARPRRWEHVTLPDGRDLVIATLRTDTRRGDYVCQLANPGTAPMFS
jgi:hypothetical protein